MHAHHFKASFFNVRESQDTLFSAFMPYLDFEPFNVFTNQGSKVGARDLTSSIP